MTYNCTFHAWFTHSKMTVNFEIQSNSRKKIVKHGKKKKNKENSAIIAIN